MIKNAMTMTDGKCECCMRERKLIGVASSTIAPMSMAFCKECLVIGAEPLGLMQALIEVDGHDNWHESFWAILVFDPGTKKYRPFGEVVGHAA